jgi:hypothetical protein
MMMLKGYVIIMSFMDAEVLDVHYPEIPLQRIL